MKQFLHVLHLLSRWFVLLLQKLLTKAMESFQRSVNTTKSHCRLECLELSYLTNCDISVQRYNFPHTQHFGEYIFTNMLCKMKVLSFHVVEISNDGWNCLTKSICQSFTRSSGCQFQPWNYYGAIISAASICHVSPNVLGNVFRNTRTLMLYHTPLTVDQWKQFRTITDKECLLQVLWLTKLIYLWMQVKT